ncbi:MAG TPA: ParB/RepB/Spo0J family partition protein, partial [Reyranella sp.]|nr:ParB/RepB/Spo0J family partition protein [Reyranella sp.]
PPANRTPMTLPTAHLHAGKYQPRTTFENIDVLVDSVKQYGLLQPILVRPTGVPDSYEIIAGERRWRAAQKAQLHEVPVVIRTLDDLDALQLSLVENLQRADLSPVDEAQGYRRLMTDFNQTQDEIAHTMGRSRPHIANTLRLLDLPESVREMIRRDEISAGHGRQLLTFPDPEAMAERVVAEKLSVRDLEKLAAGERLKKAASAGRKPSAPNSPKSADTKALEKRIEEALGLKAALSEGSGERTVLTLKIDNYDQLDTVVERLTRR